MPEGLVAHRASCGRVDCRCVADNRGCGFNTGCSACQTRFVRIESAANRDRISGVRGGIQGRGTAICPVSRVEPGPRLADSDSSACRSTKALGLGRSSAAEGLALPFASEERHPQQLCAELLCPGDSAPLARRAPTQFISSAATFWGRLAFGSTRRIRNARSRHTL